MFNDFIVQPLFNLLVLIYALVPGHNFGLSLIIFTIVIRILLWPLVKKQLHQAKAMRALQPEMKRIKKEAKKDRQKESAMLMELYKERGINPLGAFPTLIVQFIVLIGLYSGLQKVIKDPHSLVDFSYPFVQNLSWIQELSQNIHRFDNTLFGFINLGQAAIGPAGFYFGAFVLVVGSAVSQYFQAAQLMPKDKDARSLRAILREAGEGKQADQSEVNAAVGQSTKYIIPGMVFIFTINLASALSLYWLVGAVVAYIQQAYVLRKDEVEMEALADEPDVKKPKKKSGKPAAKKTTDIPEAEVVAAPVVPATPKKKSNNKKAGKRKRKS